LHKLYSEKLKPWLLPATAAGHDRACHAKYPGGLPVPHKSCWFWRNRTDEPFPVLPRPAAGSRCAYPDNADLQDH